MNANITVGIPTKDRYDALAICLTSIAMQTLKPKEVIIVDDSDDIKNITTLPNCFYALKLLDFYGVEWRVQFGIKKGQHYSHQYIQDTAKYDWIFRIDDDCIAEPNVLEELWKIKEIWADSVSHPLGAVGCPILMPDPQKLPDLRMSNNIQDINAPNIQWFIEGTHRSVDHLNSSFLYRKGIANYNLSLSKVAHREETIFTHEIKRAGFDLSVIFSAKIWHFRQSSGGIRSNPNPSLYESDDRIFQQLLKSWNYKETNEKLVVLDNGLGDHFAFKHILKSLKEKHDKITIACCFPDVFFDEPRLKLISIAEAKLLYGDLKRWCIYTKMNEWKWNKTIVEAFNKLYNEDICTDGDQTPKMGENKPKSQALPILEQTVGIAKGAVGRGNHRSLFYPSTSK